MTRLALLALMTIVACRPPARLAGEFSKTSVADAQQGGHEGEQVRWGGIIVSTTPAKDRTCMEIVGLPLDRRARPRLVDADLGRFIACAPGFYDPKVFAAEREVTVVGRLETASRGKVGEYDYLFPRVDADTIFLWPDRRRAAYGYYDGGPAPYPYPYSYGYPYGYPYWYPYGYPGWGWYGLPLGDFHHDGGHHDGGHHDGGHHDGGHHDGGHHR